MNVLDSIYSKGFSAYLHGFSAIDAWLGTKESQIIHLLTNADTSALAKMFENLRFPGVILADAALDENDKEGFCKTWYFRCADSVNDNRASFLPLDFYRNCKTKAFIDPHEVYPLLKEIRKNLFGIKTNNEQITPLHIFEYNNNREIDPVCLLMDAALILAKYFTTDIKSENNIEKKYLKHLKLKFKNWQDGQEPNQEHQRVFLSELITSSNPALGFEFLRISGFIGKFWPELEKLGQADHSKDFHPEGNAWEHTMETFHHRKTGTNKASLQAIYAYNLRLSLALLLHDCGKPISLSNGSHRYDGHAELGEFQARRFLERLGFSSSLTADVCFLVRNHMLPAALPRLPLFRTEQIMSSPLFPLLMELYRCDESSSFKGLEGYYQSSAAYQQFLRNRKNPYRTSDGKKQKRAGQK